LCVSDACGTPKNLFWTNWKAMGGDVRVWISRALNCMLRKITEECSRKLYLLRIYAGNCWWSIACYLWTQWWMRFYCIEGRHDVNITTFIVGTSLWPSLVWAEIRIRKMKYPTVRFIILLNPDCLIVYSRVLRGGVVVGRSHHEFCLARLRILRTM
jgi:hypothetical protein